MSTRAELKARMRFADYPMVFVGAATARQSIEGMLALGYWDSGTYRHHRADEGGATATLFLLGDVASNCDYSSANTVTASNLRSLTRDYPNRVVTYRYSDGEVGAVLLASLDDDLVDILTSLKHEYPLYDEEDHSNLEMDLAYEAWDQYVKLDLYPDLQNRLDGLNVDPAPFVEDVADEATVKAWFYANGYNNNDDYVTYHGESGCPDSVVFPEMAEVTERIGDLLVARWESSLLAPYVQCPGQDSLV